MQRVPSTIGCFDGEKTMSRYERESAEEEGRQEDRLRERSMNGYDRMRRKDGRLRAYVMTRSKVPAPRRPIAKARETRKTAAARRARRARPGRGLQRRTFGMEEVCVSRRVSIGSAEEREMGSEGRRGGWRFLSTLE